MRVKNNAFWGTTAEQHVVIRFTWLTTHGLCFSSLIRLQYYIIISLPRIHSLLRQDVRGSANIIYCIWPFWRISLVCVSGIVIEVRKRSHIQQDYLMLTNNIIVLDSYFIRLNAIFWSFGSGLLFGTTLYDGCKHIVFIVKCLWLLLRFYSEILLSKTITVQKAKQCGR